MPEQFGPLVLNEPLIRPRAELPPRPPRFIDRLSEQQKLARELTKQIRPIAKRFSEMSPAQRKAVFFKIKHQGMRIDLVGTGLRVFAEGDNETLAAPKEQNLDKLLKKISDFESNKPKNGHLPSEHLVFPMNEFSEGQPFDRLSSELVDQYEELIKSEALIYEVELFANVESGKRAELEKILADLKAAIGLTGTIFEYEIISEFARAVIRTTGAVFKKLVETPDWQIRISRLEQRPIFETFTTSLKEFTVSNIGIEGPEPTDPEVCIIDSGVSPGNPFLEKVCKENKFKSYVAGNDSPYDEYNHGSGVASLAAFSELNISAGAQHKAGAWIVGARILDANNYIETRLFSRVLTELVEHYAPQGIRIFNLSVCVKNKPWNEQNRRACKRSSWVARRIDQLSKEHDVVFVISSGNIIEQQVNGYLADGGDYPAYFIDDVCKILDPSQAALAITVGSVVPGATVQGGLHTPVAERFCPSPFTRVGPGILGEIKPEVVDFGGNWVQTAQPKRVTSNSGTDVMMASNKLTPAVTHHAATSFATPKITYKLARILAGFNKAVGGNISACLLRAMLINSCSIKRSGFQGDEIDSFASKFTTVGSLSRILGYGVPDASLAIVGNQYSVNTFYQGVLETNKVAFFRIPIPKELVAADGKKRLTVTVTFAPDVKLRGLQDYLGSRLQWRVFRGDADQQEVLKIMSEEQETEDNGESEKVEVVAEEGLQNDEAESESENLTKELKKSRYGFRQRSKGTVQHDVFEWIHHRQEFSQNDYLLAVSLYQRWSSKKVQFAVAVRLEDVSQSIPIYTKVQARLKQLQAKTQIKV